MEVSCAGILGVCQSCARYIDLTRRDQLVRRDVAEALNDLRECLEARKKGVPDAVLLEADRLESLFFDGYDPYFEGDEPPGLWRSRIGTSMVLRERLGLLQTRFKTTCTMPALLS